jgi:hypothetical protein
LVVVARFFFFFFFVGIRKMDYGRASKKKGNMLAIYTHSSSRSEKSQLVLIISHVNSFKC